MVKPVDEERDFQDLTYKQEKAREYQAGATRQHIIDMLDYALGRIEKWSVAQQKLLGNKMADLMEDMLIVANDLDRTKSPKTPLKKLDYMNGALQDMIELAYRKKYLKGATSKNEWLRLSQEVGKSIGGFMKAVYNEEMGRKSPGNKRHMHGRRPR